MRPRALVLTATCAAVLLTLCDQLFHVRTDTLVYHWDPRVAGQTVIVPLTFFAAAVAMLVTAGRVRATRTGSALVSLGVVVTAYLLSGLLEPRYAGPYALALALAWLVRAISRGAPGLAVVSCILATGGVLGEAMLSAAGEFAYAHPNVLGVPWWLFPLYLHGAVAAVDVVQRLRDIPPSTGSMTPVRKPAAGDSRNAAALPNSSGLP